MSFDSTFAQWLDGALPAELPAGVRGFAFNLTEVASGEYAVEVIGAERFDSNDEDWACEEAWEPDDRSIGIPSGAMGNDWEEVLDSMSALVVDYLSNGARRATLKRADGVAIGFVDGNLKILWPPSK